MSDISSFCTMGGMMTMNNNDSMHKMYKLLSDMQVILPDDHNMHSDIGIESDTTSEGPLEPGIPHESHNTSSNNINHDDKHIDH